MNCHGKDCPIKETCKRYTHPVQENEYYSVTHYYANGCNFHLRDETHEEYLEARNETLRENFKEQCGMSR